MWFPGEVHEEHYLASDDPRRQSGFGGDEGKLPDRVCERLSVGVARPLVAARDRAYGLDFSARLGAF